LLNRNNSSLTESYDFTEIISDDAYDNYGKYFAIYSDNGTQKLYISSYHRDDLPKIYQIDEVKVCSHFQKFDESSNTCIGLSSGYFSHGIQNETALACNSFNETKDFNRLLGETFWDFGCSSKQFGQQCQAWSAYKDRIGVSVSPGYKWDDSQDNVCKEIQDAANQMSWTSITSCRKCYYTEGCTYSSGDCKPSSSTVVPSLQTIHSTCNNLTSEKQNTTLWGESELNYSNFDSVLSLKPNITTPRFTMCYYKLNYPEKFRGNVTFHKDSNTDISIRSSKNGVATDLSPIGKRMLEGVHRNLATKEVYEILDADFIEIYYGANAELSTSIFTMTFDQTNYFQGTTQGSATSSFDLWKILAIVVLIVVIIILVVYSITDCRRCWKTKFRVDDEVRAIDRVIVIDEAVVQIQLSSLNKKNKFSRDGMTSETKQKTFHHNLGDGFEKMGSKNYKVDFDKFKAEINNEETKQKETIRTIENCKHTPHSGCIREIIV
jgi:uncharacterized membrane protein